MGLADQKLSEMDEQITKGVAPTPETVRTFLLWFGAERRGYRIVKQIRSKLKHHALVTVPDFEYAYIDSLIEFTRASGGKSDPLPGTAVADPTYRVSRLEAANHPPVFVSPDASLQQAVTLMLTNDFSQLPVMTGPRDIKGIVSWKTIGSRLALRCQCDFVRDAMEPARVIPLDDSLFEAISTIALYDYVLVQAPDKIVSGIITASDFSDQFRNLAEPFLLIGEIENGMRRILHGKYSAGELEAAKAPGDENRKVEGVGDLTIGEQIRLIDSDKAWKKLKIEIDRVEFVARLSRVREIRNDVMHFDPEGLEDDDLNVLREFARFLKRLRDVGAT